MPRIIVMIPARYGSSRFPGKPLALLGGKAIILHVLSRVNAAGYECVVATDNELICDTVKGAGFNAIMTSEAHRSGTDRIREALDTLERESGREFDVVINVQGDEPFIEASQLNLLAQCFEDPTTDIATLCRRFPQDGDYADLENPNLVKLVKDNSDFAMYFSRSVIPYMRGVERKEWPARHQYFTHIGIYGYRADVLRRVTEMPAGVLESCESLEQLRWLESGLKIKVKESEGLNIGIDTPEDLEAAEKLCGAEGDPFTDE